MIRYLVLFLLVVTNITFALEYQFTQEEETLISNFIKAQEKEYKLSNEQKDLIIKNFIYQLHPEVINKAGITPQPLYEFGVGFMYASFPDYPGASNGQRIFLPFPSAVYRGDILQITEDEGVRGRFYNKNNFELDISFDGTLSSDGKDNSERKGMPKLDTLLEFGPKIRYKLIDQKGSEKIKFNINFATRLAISSDLKDTYGRGLSFNPFLELKFSNLLKKESLFFSSLNFKLATNKLQDYYYGVKEIYETNNRKAYKANSGLMEISWAIAYYYPIAIDFWIYGGSILSFYKGSANLQSPLHSTDMGTSIFMGVYWNFHKSEYLVFSK